MGGGKEVGVGVGVAGKGGMRTRLKVMLAL